MTRKADFGPLLALKDGKARAPRRRARYQIDPAIRLPSLARLLEIDAQAEHAAMLARMSVDASNVVKATENTNSVADAGDERVGDAGQATPPPMGLVKLGSLGL